MRIFFPRVSEWFSYVLAASLVLAAGVMVWARQRKLGELCSEVIIDASSSSSSDKTTMDSIVEAQRSLQKVHRYIVTANVAILRLWSIALARSPKVHSLSPSPLSIGSF